MPARKIIRENCVSCAFYWAFHVMGPAGLACINMSCSHQPGDSKISITNSKFYQSLSLFMAIYVAAFGAYDMYHYLHQLTDFVTFIEPIMRCVYQIKICLVVTTLNLNTNYHVAACRRLSKIIQGRFFLENFDCLPRSTVRLCRYLSIGLLVTTPVLVVLYGVYMRNIYGNHYLLILAEVYGTYVDISILLVFGVQVWLHYQMFQFVFINTKSFLDSKIGLGSVSARQEKLSVRHYQLRQMRLLYSSSVRNYKIMNRFANPCLLVWYSLSIFTMVFNIFVVIKAISNGNTDIFGSSYVNLQFRIHSTTVLIVFCLNCMRLIAEVGDDMHSFLLRYPISKLSSAESTQVEMFITTLNMQKPIMVASDLFTLGARLNAALTGVVVTYVLVCLQFKASWTE